jgi:hypothetical protein
MLRRRRPPKNEAIHFSFDSFLDLVTNVVGIIIRLILVTWVGARAYHTSMQWIEGQAEVSPRKLAAPQVVDDPLHVRIENSRHDLDDAKERLLGHLKEVETAEADKEKAKFVLTGLITRRDELDAERRVLEAKGPVRGVTLEKMSLSVAEVRERSKKLLDQIKKIEAGPTNMKQLKYHAPLSRAVTPGEELMFECKAGRVTLIDLPMFLQEMKGSLEEIGNELKTTYRVERRTSTIGAFRLRYAVERERTQLDAPVTPTTRGFRYGLSEWVVEPVMPDRGETAEQALRPKSVFREMVDNLDPQLSVVTFWVYPDSFETFRRLRDHLYDRGHDVAGRPLPADAPIAASKYGTASRGQ